MRVQTIPLNADNFGYILSNEATGNAAVIDVSNQPGQMTAALSENGLNLKMILTTHKHWDHANGNNEMKTNFPGWLICTTYARG
jgi:glyoxylase-like metal-dependent hydrolase (beta-lactamase superfamily II)